MAKWINTRIVARELGLFSSGLDKFRENYIKEYKIVNGTTYIRTKSVKKIKKIYKLLREL